MSSPFRLMYKEVSPHCLLSLELRALQDQQINMDHYAIHRFILFKFELKKNLVQLNYLNLRKMTTIQ